MRKTVTADKYLLLLYDFSHHYATSNEQARMETQGRRKETGKRDRTNEHVVRTVFQSP